jgi:2-polyprenyl-6-methoxyphenol hydroxylase-like FAD-dependent oxidoreductase
MAQVSAPISTLVIGGGIGGLSLARELALRNLPVTVLERAAQIAPIGAGIIMNPNAMGVLERNGLAAEVRADAWPYMRRETRDATGRLLAVRDYGPLYDSGRLPPGALVHRAHLHEVLHRSLPPGTVRLGVTARSIEVRADKVVVATEGGDSFEADLLVGADGIRSLVRRQLFGEVAPTYMGYRSHRLVVPAHAEVRDFTEFLGRGQRIGLVPISPTRLYIWTTFNSPREPAPVLESADQFRALFAQFTDPRIREIFAGLRSAEGIITTDVEEIRQECWVAGRAALLGDAVHAMTPNIGQGAGMAMEDAVVLAEELTSSFNLEDSLKNYEKRRLPRAEMIVNVSRAVGEDGQQSGRLACWLRNRRIRRDGQNQARMQAELERLLSFPE